MHLTTQARRQRQGSDRRRWAPACGAALLVVLTTGRAGGEDTMTPQGFGPCGGETAISIETLYGACGVPGDCSTPLPCEDARCRIRGVVSRVNIWDRRIHPWIPSSKLLLESPDGRINLEVQLSDSVASRIIDGLQHPPAGWEGVVEVTGHLTGIDLPMMRGCRRALVLTVSDADALSFQTASEPPSDRM